MDKVIEIEIAETMNFDSERVAYFVVDETKIDGLIFAINNFLLENINEHGDSIEDIIAKEFKIKYLYSIHDTLGNFERALEYMEKDSHYTFYVNDEEESDENVIMYCNGNLLSDNFFAQNELFEVLARIFNGVITQYFMSESMEYNYKSMIENNFFQS